MTISKIKPAISRFKKGSTRPYQLQKINLVTDSYYTTFGLFGKSLSLYLNELENYCELTVFIFQKVSRISLLPEISITDQRKQKQRYENF